MSGIVLCIATILLTVVNIVFQSIYIIERLVFTLL